MLDLDALAAAPTCRACGTQFLGPWCPLCHLGSPVGVGTGRSWEDPEAIAAAQISRMLRRIGRWIAAARRIPRLCPTCKHYLRRCDCGDYTQIDWFGGD